MTQNGTKTDLKRDEKGRFVSGSKGGPGRGNRKPKKITIDEIELALQQDLRSKDPKIRHPAVKLLLMLKRQVKEQDNSTMLSPEIAKLLDHQLEQQQAENSEYEVIDE